eukprot:CAMPEP_0170449064 /NCGR_PEP_ID=MMETSP0117_2-20130122/51047_1 /TAXON_ID=400756 /ORGANISM="Durinskia baltica, Strain CSIRO CS-38" /LENGTH=158 /DNA_ID=CAMNT_0010710285 /DNA_START=1 /DNA_END=473 /DNA_ORIENTATION=+
MSDGVAVAVLAAHGDDPPMEGDTKPQVQAMSGELGEKLQVEVNPTPALLSADAIQHSREQLTPGSDETVAVKQKALVEESEGASGVVLKPIGPEVAVAQAEAPLFAAPPGCPEQPPAAPPFPSPKLAAGPKLERQSDWAVPGHFTDCEVGGPSPPEGG